MKKIKVLIKQPQEPAGHIIRIDNTLKALQRIVGGYIETVTITDGVVLICNEEGKIRDLPVNCTVAGIPDRLYGTVIIAGTEGDEFTDIPDFITLDFWKRYMMEAC